MPCVGSLTSGITTTLTTSTTSSNPRPPGRDNRHMLRDVHHPHPPLTGPSAGVRRKGDLSVHRVGAVTDRNPVPSSTYRLQCNANFTFDDAVAQGRGVAVVDGRIVENLHVRTARATLDRAAAIAAMDAVARD